MPSQSLSAHRLWLRYGCGRNLGELVKAGGSCPNGRGQEQGIWPQDRRCPGNEAIRSLESGIEVALDWGHRPTSSAREMGTVILAQAAVIAVFSGLPLAEIVGRGTGIDDHSLCIRMRDREALEMNRPNPNDALDVLARSGFEIGGIAGLILGAAYMRKPVLVDGFIPLPARS